MKVRGAPTEAVRKIDRWPRCACMVCLGLDHRYPNDGYQLAFWRYTPDERLGRPRQRPKTNPRSPREKATPN